MASLAGTWKGLDDETARKLYRRAYEIDPSDPYPLGNFLGCEIARHRSVEIVSLMAPSMHEAVRRCRDQASVNMNMPWAYYDMGKFQFLLDQPYDGLAAYARAVRVSLDDGPVESALQTVTHLQEAIAESRPELEWARRFLLVARVAKLMPRGEGEPAVAGDDRKLQRALNDFRAGGGLATEGASPIRGPVVIVAGGTDPDVQERMEGYRGMLLEAFRDFTGTIISGGTTAGICGLIGEVGQTYPDSISTLGYLPRGPLPDDARPDDRYDEIRRTSGEELSPLEPLQNWIDLIASGLDPSRVKVLGINGGSIAAIEYRIALALGARVGIPEDSGREAGKLFTDEDWALSGNLTHLPADPMTLRAFVGSGSPELPAGTRETLARAIHEEYTRNRARSLRDELAAWEDQPPMFRESSAQQADHVIVKLRQIGCEIHEVTDREPAAMSFSEAEIETMAEMEHGRWNVERLMDGWRWGSEKDVERKISPYLVSWRDLPEEIKEWDRETVRAIPDYLARKRLEIRRKTSDVSSRVAVHDGPSR
jgi:hypothetical protein